MDSSQIRNFKDFLQLYNKVTELCFSSCVDNFFSRSLNNDESICIERCVGKFANVNQKMLGVYVELQSEITNRRVAEMEALQKQNEVLQQQQQINTIAPETIETPATTESVSLA